MNRQLTKVNRAEEQPRKMSTLAVALVSPVLLLTAVPVSALTLVRDGVPQAVIRHRRGILS